MINVRHSVFETNSSSTHSISISSESDGIYEILFPDNNGALNINITKDFGWKWERYNDCLTKLEYCAIFCKDIEDLTEMLVDMLKEYTGAKIINFHFDNDCEIDHQSNINEGGACINAFSDKETLKEFIFNPNSWLFTGNDNDDPPGGFYLV